MAKKTKKTQRLEQMNLQLGLNFDDPTPKETAMHQRMAETIEILDCYKDTIALDNRRSRLKNPQNYDRLLEAYSSQGINIENPSGNDVSYMRRQLKEIMGYNKLIGNNGEKVLIHDAKPERVIRVYQDCIKRAKAIQTP